jgi:hypothetical protein
MNRRIFSGIKIYLGDGSMLSDDFDYYTAHQDEIINGHLGEFVVIKDAVVLGYYKAEMEAFNSMKNHELGTFMVKKCQLPGTDIVTYFNNQVRFA